MRDRLSLDAQKSSIAVLATRNTADAPSRHTRSHPSPRHLCKPNRSKATTPPPCAGLRPRSLSRSPRRPFREGHDTHTLKRGIEIVEVLSDPLTDAALFWCLAHRTHAISRRVSAWENTDNETVLERARAEIRKSCGDDVPPSASLTADGSFAGLTRARAALSETAERAIQPCSPGSQSSIVQRVGVF